MSWTENPNDGVHMKRRKLSTSEVVEAMRRAGKPGEGVGGLADANLHVISVRPDTGGLR